MKKYRIEVTEVLSRIVEINGESAESSLSKEKKMYQQCDVVLDASDYVFTDFSVKDDYSDLG